MEQMERLNDEKKITLKDIYSEVWYEEEFMKDVKDYIECPEICVGGVFSIVKEYFELKDNNAGEDKIKECFGKYKEILKEKLNENISNISKKYSKKLTDMFRALFDCDYKEIIAMNGNAYEFSDSGREFIRFIIKTANDSEGTKVILREYKKVDIFYRAVLLAYVTEFAESEQCLKSNEFLKEKLYEKFNMNNSIKCLLDELRHLNEFIGELTADDEWGDWEGYNEITRILKKGMKEIFYKFGL